MSDTVAYSKLESDSRFASKNQLNEVKGEVEAIASGTGGKSYPTIVAALAVPHVDNEIFSVDKYLEGTTTPNPEAGVYAYDSTASNGWRKVNDFGGNGKVELGNQNTVNGNEVYVKVVKNDDLRIVSENMFNPAEVQNDKLINSSGGIQTVAGWKMSKTDVSDHIGEHVSFFGKTGAQGLYYAFYDIDDVLISFVGYNPTLVISVVVPSNAKWLYIDIKRNTDSDDSVFSQFRINAGSSILPYSPYDPTITEIKGIKLASGSGGEGVNYDQSLNTTDDVEFNSVTANQVEITGVLKSGTLSSPPVGLVTGEFWLDTTDSATHPQLRQKI